jgi:threonine/homoserine/homoserine lactone efflux protein
MTYTETLWLYALLVFGIVIVPGMDMLFVLANALTGGRRAGLAATSGVMLGGAAHALFGAVGLGLVLQWMPGLVRLMLIAGAGYMAWIGWTLARSSITVDRIGKARSRSASIAFRQGLVTCLINPKAYLFVLSVFPQFIRPVHGPLWQQAIALGIITVFAQFVVYGGLALAASGSRNLLVGRPGIMTLIGRSAGLLLILVAGLTLWQGWHASA